MNWPLAAATRDEGSDTFSGRIGERELGENQGHERPLPETRHHLAWRIGEHQYLGVLRFMDGPLQVARGVDGVCIREQQPFSARFRPRSKPHWPFRSNPV